MRRRVSPHRRDRPHLTLRRRGPRSIVPRRRSDRPWRDALSRASQHPRAGPHRPRWACDLRARNRSKRVRSSVSSASSSGSKSCRSGSVTCCRARARSGRIAKKGALGNSCASAAIFHVSSPFGFAMPPFPLVLRAASANGEPTSTRAASTRIRRMISDATAKKCARFCQSFARWSTRCS